MPTTLHEVMNHDWIATLADESGHQQVSLMTTDQTATINPSASIRRFFFRDSAGNVVNVLSHR